MNIRAFLSFVVSYQHALTPSVRRYFFADANVLIMFWHDFGREGGGAIVIMFAKGASGRYVPYTIASCSLANFVKQKLLSEKS